MITELTILKTEKPENIMEQIASVEISGLEKTINYSINRRIIYWRIRKS